MLHIDIPAGIGVYHDRAVPPRTSLGARTSSLLPAAGTAPATVQIVEADQETQLLLTRWLAAAGIESRGHSHLGACLKAHRTDAPGCLVIDAQPSAISGLESQAILLPLSVRCPIVVMASEADIVMPPSANEIGAMALVRKPLREPEVVEAIRVALDVARRWHLIASRHAELCARFATLSPRERQVMALVTTGKLNKQVGGELGVSEITVKAHRGAAMRKMGARSLADLVRMADAIGERLRRG
jgi:FixJ family two-component response regulator